MIRSVWSAKPWHALPPSQSSGGYSAAVTLTRTLCDEYTSDNWCASWITWVDSQMAFTQNNESKRSDHPTWHMMDFTFTNWFEIMSRLMNPKHLQSAIAVIVVLLIVQATIASYIQCATSYNAALCIIWARASKRTPSSNTKQCISQMCVLDKDYTRWVLTAPCTEMNARGSRNYASEYEASYQRVYLVSNLCSAASVGKLWFYLSDLLLSITVHTSKKVLLTVQVSMKMYNREWRV